MKLSYQPTGGQHFKHMSLWRTSFYSNHHRGGVDVPFGNEHPTDSFSALWPFANFCTNCHLLHKMSLMKSEKPSKQYSLLPLFWIPHKSLMVRPYCWRYHILRSQEKKSWYGAGNYWKALCNRLWWKKNQLSYLAVNHLNYNNDLGSKTDMFMGSITSWNI